MQLTHSWLPTRGVVRRAAAVCLALGLTLPLANAGRASAGPNATITGSFADSCHDFAAFSSKDISHVEIHYADGRILKDEAVKEPRYAIDGITGDEIALVEVKSGITRQTFSCSRTNSPPTAILEIETPSSCFPFSGILYCLPDAPRDTWTRPDNGLIQWPYEDAARQCPISYSFRGTSSTDPDDDIASWSLDFGDGTSVSGSWSGQPPTEIAHTYDCSTSSSPTVTLTITDSAGQTDSDALAVLYVDATPD